MENAADASEEEFDEDDEKYVAVPRRSSEDKDITNLNSSDPAYVEVSDLDDEEDNEFNEEEELSRLIDEERREMECSLKAESLKDSTSRPTETECGLIEVIKQYNFNFHNHFLRIFQLRCLNTLPVNVIFMKMRTPCFPKTMKNLILKLILLLNQISIKNK